MGSIFGIAKKGFGKALRGDKTIKGVRPTLGRAKTDKYKEENQRKLAQAKVKLKAMQTVEKDVKKGYESVIKKGE